MLKDMTGVLVRGIEDYGLLNYWTAATLIGVLLFILMQMVSSLRRSREVSSDMQDAVAAGEQRSVALFRTEALQHHLEQGRWGQVGLLQPVSTKLMVWAFVSVICAFLIFLAMAPYARKQSVRGYLAPSAGMARIIATEPGVVDALSVKEGDIVTLGQTLITISTAQLAKDGQDVNATVVDLLQRQKQLLLSGIRSEEQRLSSEQKRLTAQILSLQSEILYMDQQVQKQSQQVKLMAESVKAAEELLKKGFLTKTELNRRRSMELDAQQGLDLLRQQQLGKQSQLSQLGAELEQLPATFGSRMQDLKAELTSLEQQSAQAVGRQSFVLRAPIGGRVSTLQAMPGQPVDPQKPLMSIVPQDSNLDAELFVPARAIGFVETGDRVRLLYDAFPFQNFGVYGGTVTRVSQTMVTGAEVAGPIQLAEPAYRVTVRLDRPDIDAGDRSIALQPDMLLTADIILDRRPLLSWIAHSLTGVGSRELGG